MAATANDVKDACILNNEFSEYVTILIAGTQYPMKLVSKPNSRFSTSRWLKTKSPKAKNFQPKIILDKGWSGDVMYYAWENTIHVPEKLEFARYMG